MGYFKRFEQSQCSCYPCSRCKRDTHCTGDSFYIIRAQLTFWRFDMLSQTNFNIHIHVFVKVVLRPHLVPLRLNQQLPILVRPVQYPPLQILRVLSLPSWVLTLSAVPDVERESIWLNRCWGWEGNGTSLASDVVRCYMSIYKHWIQFSAKEAEPTIHNVKKFFLANENPPNCAFVRTNTTYIQLK